MTEPEAWLPSPCAVSGTLAAAMAVAGPLAQALEARIRYCAGNPPRSPLEKEYFGDLAARDFSAAWTRQKETHFGTAPDGTSPHASCPSAGCLYASPLPAGTDAVPAAAQVARDLRLAHFAARGQAGQAWMTSAHEQECASGPCPWAGPELHPAERAARALARVHAGSLDFPAPPAAAVQPAARPSTGVAGVLMRLAGRSRRAPRYGPRAATAGRRTRGRSS
jgi:hypothetical protein